MEFMKVTLSLFVKRNPQAVKGTLKVLVRLICF